MVNTHLIRQSVGVDVDNIVDSTTWIADGGALSRKDVLDKSFPRITHSICQVCSAKVLEDLKKSDGKTTDNEQPSWSLSPRGLHISSGGENHGKTE